MIFIYPDYPVYPVKKWDFLYYLVTVQTLSIADLETCDYPDRY